MRAFFLVLALAGFASAGAPADLDIFVKSNKPAAKKKCADCACKECKKDCQCCDCCPCQSGKAKFTARVAGKYLIVTECNGKGCKRHRFLLKKLGVGKAVKAPVFNFSGGCSSCGGR